MIVVGLLTLPMAILFFIFYAHIVSLLDPILTFVFGGALVLALLVGSFNLIVNLKDFIVSIFKDDKTKNDRGFKKNL